MSQTFTIRSLSNPLLSWLKPRAEKALLTLARWLLIWATVQVCLLVLLSKLPHSEAKEQLVFALHLQDYRISLPIPQKSGYWQLPGGTAHQNDVLRKCQDGLRARGIDDTGVQRYGCGILVSENESLDPLRLGDHGHAFGICQQNLGRVYAKDFLRKHPEWTTLEKQLQYCNDRFAAAYKRYGNLFQATVEHNSPAAAARKRDACHISPCYFQRVVRATEKLSLL